MVAAPTKTVTDEVREIIPRLSDSDTTSRLLATAQLSQLLFARGGEVLDQLASGTGVEGVQLLVDLLRARAKAAPPKPAVRRPGWSVLSAPAPKLANAGGLASLLALAGK